jgi:hypothetical protein
VIAKASGAWVTVRRLPGRHAPPGPLRRTTERRGMLGRAPDGLFGWERRDHSGPKGDAWR